MGRMFKRKKFRMLYVTLPVNLTLCKHDDDSLNVDTAAADIQNIVLKAATLSLKFKSTKF